MVTKLKSHSFIKKPTGPVVVTVLDGIGIGKDEDGNAVLRANPTNLFSYIEEAKSKNLYTELKAHGPAVGLPSDDDMGNSEVGHNAIGAGQIYAQGAKLVNEALSSGTFFESESWKKIINLLSKKGTLHFIGLLSDGNVHSHISQLFKMLDGAKKGGVKSIRIHPLLDGRDVPPTSGLSYIESLEQKLKELCDSGVDAKIASGGGRMYMTMDRYNSEWSMVERGYNAHVHGKIDPKDIKDGYLGYYKSATEAIQKARELFPQKQDQYNPPFVIVDNDGEPVGNIKDGDAVINFNFRGDRAIEISKSFEDENLKEFDRGTRPSIFYAGLLEYDGDAHIPRNFLVPPPTIKNVSAEFIAASGFSTYAISETQKFGHVTYFWNGNRSGKIDSKLETYEEVPSFPTDTIEAKPEMRAPEIADKAIEAVNSGKYDFIRLNFANGDMVGHTGNKNSIIKAVQVVDHELKRLVDAVLAQKGVILITADHGNAEQTVDKKGNPMTSHTLNKVPCFILSAEEVNYKISTEGITTPGIANITASFLNLLGLDAPTNYEKSFLVKKS